MNFKVGKPYEKLEKTDKAENLTIQARDPVEAEQLLLAEGRRVEVIDAVPPEDVLSINTLEQLAAVDAIFRTRAAAERQGQGASA